MAVNLKILIDQYFTVSSLIMTGWGIFIYTATAVSASIGILLIVYRNN